MIYCKKSDEKSQIDLAPNYFDRYIQKFPDISWRAMRTYGPELSMKEPSIFLEIGDRVYDEQNGQSNKSCNTW